MLYCYLLSQSFITNCHFYSSLITNLWCESGWIMDPTELTFSINYKMISFLTIWGTYIKVQIRTNKFYSHHNAMHSKNHSAWHGSSSCLYTFCNMEGSKTVLFESISVHISNRNTAHKNIFFWQISKLSTGQINFSTKPPFKYHLQTRTRPIWKYLVPNENSSSNIYSIKYG